MSDSTPTSPVRRDPYAALRYRDFRILIIGRFVAQLGEMMVSVAVGWELYERTGDSLALGLVGLVQIIPVLLLSVLGGYVADRYDRRRVTLISQLLLMACSAVLAVISLTNGSLLVLYITLGIIGVGRAFNNPAEAALTPQTVPPDQYLNAVTWSSTVWQMSAIIGPALCGFLIALGNHAAPVYIINVIAGGVLVAALLMLHIKTHGDFDATETPGVAIRKGWRFLRGEPIIFASITLDMFAVLLGGATFLLPVFAKDILHTDATGLGILRAAMSIGALCMAMYISRRPPFQRAGFTLLWAVIGFGVATIVFGISTSFILSVAMMFMLGALDNISVVIRHTLVMIHTPDAMRGRVSAINSIFIGTSNEMGGFRAGLMASMFGPVAAVVVGGIGTIAVVAAIARYVPSLRRYGVLGH